MDFKRTANFGHRKGATTKQHKKVMNFNKLGSLENIAALLHKKTGTQLLDESSTTTNPRTTMGGYNMNNAHAIPYHTCHEGKFNDGVVGTLHVCSPTSLLGDGKIV